MVQLHWMPPAPPSPSPIPRDASSIICHSSSGDTPLTEWEAGALRCPADHRISSGASRIIIWRVTLSHLAILTITNGAEQSPHRFFMIIGKRDTMTLSPVEPNPLL